MKVETIETQLSGVDELNQLNEYFPNISIVQLDYDGFQVPFNDFSRQ